MLSKTLFIAFAAIATVARAATPPGCLLGAVNTYEDPANIKAVCSDKQATSKIATFCGDTTKDALSSFADLCKIAGVTVDTTLPTSTGSSTATGTARPSGSSGINPATTAGSTPTGAAANQSSGTTVSTGAAGKLEVGAFVAGLGIFAALF